MSSKMKLIIKISKDEKPDEIHKILKELEKKLPNEYFGSVGFSMILDASSEGTSIYYLKDIKRKDATIPDLPCQI